MHHSVANCRREISVGNGGRRVHVDGTVVAGQQAYPKPSQLGPEGLEQRPDQGGAAFGSFPRQQVTARPGEPAAASIHAAGSGSAFSVPPPMAQLANGQVHRPQQAPQASVISQSAAEEAVSVAVPPASIPRTVPLTSVSQTIQQVPPGGFESPKRSQDACPEPPQGSFQPVQPQVEVTEAPPQPDASRAAEAGDQKPKSMDLAQKQQRAKMKPDSQDWSPVTDLSPILDVSPSVEAAEQELMQRFQEEERLPAPAGIPRATSGTISGMLADFNKAMGLNSVSPGEELPGREGVELAEVPEPSTDAPWTPKRVHRRLPQPTVEQMQAAVAMAAQGPGQRPVSPMVPPSRKEGPQDKPVPAPRAISASTVVTPAVSAALVTATVAAPGSSMSVQPVPSVQVTDQLGLPRAS